MNEIAETLKALERELQTTAARSSRERLNALLANDFREFGSSGRFYTKADAISALTGPADASGDPADMQEFSVRPLSETIMLVTYKSVRHASLGRQETRRTSIWRLGETTWQMIFHQGTPVEEA